MNKALTYLTGIVVAACIASCSSRKAVITPLPGVNIRPEEVIPSTDNQVSSLVKEARSWIGTPYRYGGHSRKGTDCSGLIMELFLKVYDVRLPRSSAMQREYASKISRSELRPGDLVFFATGSDRKRVSHVGLYVGANKMIHASSSRGVMESSLSGKYWQRTFHSTGRIVETNKNKIKEQQLQVPEIDAARLQELYDALDQTIDSLYVVDPEIFD